MLADPDIAEPKLFGPLRGAPDALRCRLVAGVRQMDADLHRGSGPFAGPVLPPRRGRSIVRRIGRFQFAFHRIEREPRLQKTATAPDPKTRSLIGP